VSPASPPPKSSLLRPILEIKRTLAGREKRFECRVLETEGPHLAVLFVAQAAMHVHGVDLPPGTVTFGHFWSDRLYNVYQWLDRATGRVIGTYVNLSADTRIDGERLEWLDLIVDVLVLPGEVARVLDEDEIPPDASAGVRERIARALAAVMDALPALADELERFRARVWPAVKEALDAPGAPAGP
jgi:hypothetical protein